MITFYMERVDRGMYVFRTNDLSLASLKLDVLMPRRYFVSNYLRKSLKQSLRALKESNIAIPEGINENSRIKIIRL